jgi:transposase-like protein
MVTEAVQCPTCGGIDIYRHGHSATGKKRYICRNTECRCKTFIIDYTNKGYLPNVKQQIVDMAMNGSGIRDTGRVLGISPTTVIKELKKSKKR